MNFKITRLSSEQMNTLKNRFEEITLNHDFNLVYEDQVPNTGLVLLEGIMIIDWKKNDSFQIHPPGLVLGIYQLLHNVPLHFNCNVKAGSRLLLIPKSELLKIMEKKEPVVYEILQMAI